VHPVEALRDDGWRLCDLTSRPFAVNHTRRPFDAGADVAIAQGWEAGGNADEVAIRSSCLS